MARPDIDAIRKRWERGTWYSSDVEVLDYVDGLEDERDLLLVVCRHATMLVDNQANWTASGFGIINVLSNAVAGWRHEHGKEATDEPA